MKDDIKTDSKNPQPQFSEPQPNPQKTVDVVAQTAQNAPQPPQQTPASQNNAADTAGLPAQQQNAGPAAIPPTPKKIKKNRNIMPVLMAVVILLSLSGLAVYAGLIKDKEPAKPANNNPASAESEPRDNDAIQAIIKQIDSLPEDQDSSGDGLSDEQLGL